jgi:tRNA nucleotidyltransferase (CCA-adding enzyme)
LLANGWRQGLSVLLESSAWQFLPEFELTALQKLLTEISVNYQFKNSEQAWAALVTKFDELDIRDFLRKWKVSNDFISYVSDLVAAYKSVSWDLSALYRFGLEKCQLVDELKAAEGRMVDFTVAVSIHRQLQIHDKHEIVVAGKDLMDKFGIKPGPKLGELLKIIEEKIVRNECENEREAIFELVKESL